MGGFWQAQKEYKDFVAELSTKNRYFIDEHYLRIFDAVFENGENTIVIPKDYPLFRARRNPLGKDFRYISELGMNKTSRGPNRASPSGISYMYLAEDEITAIAEIKGHVGDDITVAQFRTKTELKIFSFGEDTPILNKACEEYDDFDYGGFLYMLMDAFATPVNKSAEEEYLPCQYFSEYCKKKGFSGIRYFSSARGYHPFRTPKGMYCYVLFNDDNVEYVGANQFRLNDIIYQVFKCCPVHLE